MKVLRLRSSLKKLTQSLKKQNKSIGFVPTMGFLHAGHLSLVKKAVQKDDVVIASLFVNPLQFGPKEDFKKYPRDFNRDTRMFAKAGADYLFAPSAKEFYPTNFQTEVRVSGVSQGLCGVTRPHHFGGVATVVLKLLQLVQPDRLYLGQKDFQQIRVIEQMVSDLDVGVNIVRCPTLREPDGLAMSSRNVYLSAQERLEAPKLYQALQKTAQQIRGGERRPLVLQRGLIQGLRQAKYAKIDYAEIVDARELKPMVESKELPRKGELLIVAALFFSKARLIDNILVKG